MNIKTTLLSLLTLSSITAPALAGYTHQGVHLMDGSDFGSDHYATEIINNLTEMGVPVLDGGKNNVKICTPNEDGSQVLGFYVPSKDFMVICTTEVPQWLQYETLIHETVHVIQDARDGLDNDTLEEGSRSYLNTIVNKLDDHKIDTISELYKEEDYGVEIEAFYFEDKPQIVSEELKRWVF